MAYLRTSVECPWYVYWMSNGNMFPCGTRKEQMLCINCTDYISYNVAKNMFDVSYICKVYKCSEKDAEMLRKGLDNFVADVEAKIPEVTHEDDDY